MRHRYAIDTSWQELSANRTALARRKTLEIGKILDTFPHFYVKTRPEPQKIHLNIFKKISKNFPGATFGAPDKICVQSSTGLLLARRRRESIPIRK